MALPSPEFRTLNARQHKKLAALLAAGGDANQVNDEGLTLLYKACTPYQPKAVDALLAAGADPNAWNRDGTLPLHAAMRSKDAGLTARLLAAGARPDAEPPASLRTWSGVLYQGAIVGALDALKVMAEHVGHRLDWERGTKDGGSPLLGAVRNDQPEVAAWLIRHGAQLENPAGNLGATALVQACSRGLDTMIQVLLDAGANPNAADQDGMTPLHQMVRRLADQDAMIPLAQRLLDAGANLLATNAKGLTPLQLCERSPLGRDSHVHHWLRAQEEQVVLRGSLADVAPSSTSSRPRSRL